MRVEVSCRRMDLTPAIQEYAEKRCEKLLKFFNGVQEFEVVIEKAEKEDFHTEIIAAVVNHENMVAHARGGDVYACIDEASDKLARQLHDYKERIKSHH
ncbi:MAG: ribosome hibernation-promoting factor, HPF/YfiA family [Phycisphaerales bacterium]